MAKDNETAALQTTARVESCDLAQSAAAPADAGSQLSPDIQNNDEIQQSQNRTRAVFARLKVMTEEVARVESNEKELKEALIVMAKDKEISGLQTTALAQSNEKEILFLKEVNAANARAILALQATAAQKDKEILALQASAKQKYKEILAVQALAAQKGKEILALQTFCKELLPSS